MHNSHHIDNAAKSLLSLINDLLDINKIESGKMNLVEVEYDVKDVLRSVSAMVRSSAEDKGLTFDVVVDDKLPRKLYGDSAKIKQITVNLLSNAVKYTEVGGFSLNVNMTDKTDTDITLIISVKDTGIGVKEEDRDKLFVAYERLDEQKNSSIQGTGLGLDISHRFAELMGGSLVCESVYEEGSEFILTVKQKIVDDTPIGVFIEQDESADRGYVPLFVAPDADILVVDDNPMNLNVIKGLLRATRVFVTTASSGEEAIYKIKDSHFDVVLLDHMMPGLDGVETLERIRKFAPDLPVYALTANSTLGEAYYVERGFSGYLEKPVETDLLEKTIKRHLAPEKMVEMTDEIEVEEFTELPDDMKWLYDTDGVDVDAGIRHSGGVTNFIFSLKMFYDMIEENSDIINEAYLDNNIRMYTIKVHALKSSARIIGATDLSNLCEKLEEAGNNNDKDFIKANHDKMLSDYDAYKFKLQNIYAEPGDTAGKEDRPEISDSELRDAYEALKDAVSQMDYDAVEMLLSELDTYALPTPDAEKLRYLKKALKTVDWDTLERITNAKR